MIRRRTVIAWLIALPALAAPAGAQSVPRPPSPPVARADRHLADDLEALRIRIYRERDAGLISRREARRLHRKVNLIANHVGIRGRDGLSPSGLAEFESRARALGIATPLAPAKGD